MDELYRMIEERIKASGYPGEIDGEEFYDDISEEASEKQEGTYAFLIKKNEHLIYQGTMTVMESQFDLHYVDFLLDDKTYHADFD